MATNPLLGGVEQLLLLLFVLMVLVTMAGGNPTSVLSPVLQLVTQLLVALATLAFNIVGMLAKAIFSLIPVICKSIGSGSTSTRRLR
jgi:hypothetical protein